MPAKEATVMEDAHPVIKAVIAVVISLAIIILII